MIRKTSPSSTLSPTRCCLPRRGKSPKHWVRGQALVSTQLFTSLVLNSHLREVGLDVLLSSPGAFPSNRPASLTRFRMDHGGATSLHTGYHRADLFSDFRNFRLKTALVQEPCLRIQLPSSPLRRRVSGCCICKHSVCAVIGSAFKLAHAL